MVDLWRPKWSWSELLASSVNRQLAAMLTKAAGLGVYQRYRMDQLPHDVTRRLGSSTYVVAMETSTNRDAGGFDAPQCGELIHLGPGEQRQYELAPLVLAGTVAVAECASWSRLLASGAAA